MAPAPLACCSDRTQLRVANYFAHTVRLLALLPPQVGTNVETIPLQVKGYQEITCPEALRQGRAGGALGAGAGASGIAQKCVEVKARANNPSQNDYLDVGVFGLVTETSSSMSTLGNGQDGKNDAGQFAMIDKIPAGENDLTVCGAHLLQARAFCLCVCLPFSPTGGCTRTVSPSCAVCLCEPAEHGLQEHAHGEMPNRGQGTARAADV
jgi:hypothetical protein